MKKNNLLFTLMLLIILLVSIILTFFINNINNSESKSESETNSKLESKVNVVTGANVVSGEEVIVKDLTSKPSKSDIVEIHVENVENVNKEISTNADDKKTEKPEESSEIKYRKCAVPESTGFKSYMDYRTITAKNSYQYKLQDQYAYTGNYGIRMVEGRYCIAVGTYFTTDVGCYIDLVLKNGTIIPCILADVKADIHTDEMNIASLYNGCVSEFIVDTPSLHKIAKRDGDISSCLEEWDSQVSEMIIYETNIFN